MGGQTFWCWWKFLTCAFSGILPKYYIISEGLETLGYADKNFPKGFRCALNKELVWKKKRFFFRRILLMCMCINSLWGSAWIHRSMDGWLNGWMHRSSHRLMGRTNGRPPWVGRATFDNLWLPARTDGELAGQPASWPKRLFSCVMNGLPNKS